MYQPLSEDGSITARATSYQSTTSQQVALMVRETLNYGAAAAFLEYIPNISYFADRAATGSGLTWQQGSAPSTSVYWMKSIRDGNTFIAEIGSDGGNWIQIGSPVTVQMAANVEIGIAVATGGAGGTETALLHIRSEFACGMSSGEATPWLNSPLSFRAFEFGRSPHLNAQNAGTVQSIRWLSSPEPDPPTLESDSAIGLRHLSHSPALPRWAMCW